MGLVLGAGGEAEGGFFHTFEQKSSYCVFIEVYKQPQFTCQGDTVACSGLTSSVALLVQPSGTVHSIMDHDRVTEVIPVKADLVIFSSLIGVSG